MFGSKKFKKKCIRKKIKRKVEEKKIKANKLFLYLISNLFHLFNPFISR